MDFNKPPQRKIEKVDEIKEKGPDQSYREKATVNGVEISVGWDSGYDDYTIYFPQIQPGDASSAEGVSDQVLRITRRPEVAKQVFEYATKIAQTETNVYEIFKKVQVFSRDLPYEEGEE